MQIAPAFMIPQQQPSNFPQDGFAYALSANPSGQSFADGSVAIAMLEHEGNKGPTNTDSSALQQAFYSGQQYLPNSNSAWTIPNKVTRSPEFNNG
nr:Bm7765, isoform c [Brugia malayi]